ncbi:hypothetical protein MRB53_019341 [Persea americana]|uniref:Uncharacterized protein n=1 Tax=Persea americana TaxID=3435 RepID=A0ACC2KXU1_PERAE|nr:hypothetical protein MRB53_019341 [Persea americana]|eukprot:TRINITY_DN3709_c0_g1_i1.p1 TRINITY_DN3709_c0_g1~~TRINITY_DN3709_c0_g1_i1.p1  ORF type:complete len:141 (-),score=26.23 TRINITY_DN3709_c0_g1_i1:465-887(-)
MQRQSLGSPSKLQVSAGKEERKDEEEEKRKQVEEEVKKADKLLLKATCRIDKSIHLIPVLTIFCFLLLYLASYDPSQKEMANAGFLEGHLRQKDPKEIKEFERLLEMGKSASSTILVGRRTLKEAIRFRPTNLHRKFGYF